LSLSKEKGKGEMPSMIIPADFLQEVVRALKDVKEVGFAFSESEKIVRFSIGSEEYYTRLIEGEFPPFERVIPTETKTTIKLDRTEFLRNIKLISVFARDYSNVIVCEFKKDGLTIRPKKVGSEENNAFQDIEIDGEDQIVAFNFRYVLDFLNHAEGKTLTVQILRPEAPVMFKMEGNENFIHIIMPVRIQE
jgi:DNA polymerase-3 subunit beta